MEDARKKSPEEKGDSEEGREVGERRSGRAWQRGGDKDEG